MVPLAVWSGPKHLCFPTWVWSGPKHDQTTKPTTGNMNCPVAYASAVFQPARIHLREPQDKHASCAVRPAPSLPHKQIHAKRRSIFPRLCNIWFDTFAIRPSSTSWRTSTSTTRRATRPCMGGLVSHHSARKACCAEVWLCWRCFCSTPLIRLRQASHHVAGNVETCVACQVKEMCIARCKGDVAHSKGNVAHGQRRVTPKRGVDALDTHMRVGGSIAYLRAGLHQQRVHACVSWVILLLLCYVRLPLVGHTQALLVQKPPPQVVLLYNIRT